MSFSLGQILVAIIAYLSVLFMVAHLADRGRIPSKVLTHPAVYVLSLGVFAGAMATNGVFALAAEYGYSFLLYYLGAVVMYLIATLLLLPILRLCRVYQLASLADVLTFRFRSDRVGAAVTVAMCLTLLPLLALQIQAVADSIHILAGDSENLLPAADRQDGLALLFCIIITVFSILFGTRNATSPNRNRGLVTAIAFESLVKLAAMLVLMLITVAGVFGSFEGMQAWLESRPDVIQALQQPMEGDVARTMLLVFFAGAVCMPHIFHMAFAENTDSRHLRSASWGLPLYLMLLSLPILPVTWAGMRLDYPLPVEYTGLAVGLALESVGASAAAFAAGLSAASATIIVTTLALANMCLNHLVLPGRILQLDSDQSLYAQLKWLRRILISVLILGGYVFFVAVSGRQTLTELGFVAFSGVLQFLPGLVFTPYWARANRRGFLVGLSAGLGVWFIPLLLPVFTREAPAWTLGLATRWFGDDDSAWAAASTLALLLNAGLFVLVSLFTRSSEEERVAAEICSMDDASRPARRALVVTSTDELTDRLANVLGRQTAEAEVRRALTELQFDATEARPYALRRLRSRIESNLSGLLGPSVAFNIIARSIPFRPDPLGGAEDFNLLERRLDKAQGQFTGLAADLDNLRRHYRQTLDDLPVGICSLAADDEVLLWNRSMTQITGIPQSVAVGSLLSSLDPPWRQVLTEFLDRDSQTLDKKEVEAGPGDPRWISLHKTTPAGQMEDRLVLVEDISEMERLHDELLHNERLASIGRLAAGVAHEIGNPVTGIACLAQNLQYVDDPEEIRETGEDILRQTERVTRIVESLVNFSHMGLGRGVSELTPCNLADCVDEAVHLLQLDYLARAVAFDNLCNRELLVTADSQRLLQVFVNLLSNARDASEDGERITVDAHLSEGQVQITVEDRGCGIAAELQEQVFEPFFTTKDPGEGTGLGLALVYSIMDDMNGSVQLTSPLQEGPSPGTRVTLKLPAGNYGTAFDV